MSYTHTHFNVQVTLQLLSASRRSVLWKNKSCCCGPTTQTPASSPLYFPAAQLLSLGSGVHLNLKTCSLIGLGNILDKWKGALCCFVQLVVLSCEDGTVSLQVCSIPKAPSERERQQWEPHRITWTWGCVSVTHNLCLFCCFRQSRAFVICVVPTWTDSTLASTVSSLAVLQRNIFTSTRRQSDTI